MTVRFATLADLPAMADLCQILHQDEGIFPLNPPKALAMVQAAVMSGLAVVAVMEDGTIVGCAAAVPDRMWWSDVTFLRCLFCFVHPDHRRSTHAKAMLGLMKQMVAQLGAILVADVASLDRTEGKCRLYRRQFRKLGETFISP